MPEGKTIPSVILSAKQTLELEESKKMISDARRELKVLTKLGMNVREIEAKLNWADEVQKTLLDEFGMK